MPPSEVNPVLSVTEEHMSYLTEVMEIWIPLKGLF